MWFSSGSVVGWGVWWFVGRLSFEICPDTFMLPVLLIQIWIISGWIWSVSFLNLYIKCICYTAADKCVSYLEEYAAGLYIFIFCKFFTQHVFTTFLLLFRFFIAHYHTVCMYTHKDTFSLSEADNQSGSPLGFLQTFDRFYTTRILRHLCKSLSFNDFLCLCPVGGGLCLVSVMVIAGRVKSIW